MSQSRITLIGMYNYDSTIFDLLTVPTGIDRSTLIDTILLNSGDFECLYPDAPFLKFSIGAWSRKWQSTFERWTKALAIEYNPLENYDRQEHWTDENTGTQTNKNTGTQTTDDTGTQTTKDTGTQTTNDTGTQTTNDTGTQTVTNTGTQTTDYSGSESNTKNGTEKDQQDGGNTTENQVSAYDSSTYVAHDKQIFDTDQSNTHTYTNVTDTKTFTDRQDERTDDLEQERTDNLQSQRTDNLQSQRTDNLTSQRTDNLKSKRTDDLTSERTDDLLGEHTGRIHGNIGVTTSQQMLQSELDLGYWNIYQKISDIFLTEFVIPIY